MSTIMVPEVNIWTPPIEWPKWMFDRKKKWDEYIHKIIMATAAHGGAGVSLFTTVTPASSQLYNFVYATASGFDSYTTAGHGYDGGNDYYTSSNVGSIGNDVWTDKTQTQRKVLAIYYSPDLGFPGGPHDSAEVTFFSVEGTNVPDTDDTWKDIQIQDDGGTLRTITRASRGTYFPTVGSCSTWTWNTLPNRPFFVIATGVRDFNVRV